MRHFRKRFVPAVGRVSQAPSAVRRFDDGREVCLSNDLGRAEYQSRKQQLWIAQDGLCALATCAGRMTLADSRLTGGDWQPTSQLRDDRPERNSLVHKSCLEAWHRGQNRESAFARQPDLTAKITIVMALLLVIVWLISAAPQARAQSSVAAAISGQVSTPSGTPAANSRVRVCLISAIGNPCPTTGVSLFSDYNLTQQIANPTTTDSYGNYSVFTTAGLYLLQITPQTGLTYVYYYSAGGSGGGGSGLTITAFTGGTTVEIGSTITNPSFTATYSQTPASASITNTDGVSSPFALTTPFTSATIPGGFTKTTQASTTFTLLATLGASSPTATQTLSWVPRSFAGIGAAGATNSVTASGTTAVLSNSAVLASTGVTASNIGQTYGPFTASGQKLYLLILGTGHTFVDAGTQLSIPFNSPTSVSFVNQFGDTVAMQLYESTNLYYTTIAIKVLT